MNYSKIDKDFRDLEKHTNNLINQYNKSVDSIKSQEIAINKVSQQLDYAKVKAQELQNEYSKNNTVKNADALDKQNAIVDNLKNKLSLANSRLSETKNHANELKDEINDALNPDGSRFGNMVRGIGQGISGLKDKLEKTAEGINNFKNKVSSAFKGIGKSVNSVGSKIDKFKKRVTRLILAVAIFNLLRKGLTALRNGFINLLKIDDSFNTSLNQIKANLMTAFVPIYNAILPALRTLMNVLTQVTGTIAKFVSSLFGMNLSDAKKQAQGLSSALDDTAKSGKKASGSLASFDNLEVISESDSGGGSSIDYSGAVEVNQKLLDTLNKFKEMLKSGDWAGIAQTISQAFVSSLNWLKNKIKSVDWSGIGKSISSFLTNVDFSGILVGLVSVYGEALLGFQKMILAVDWPKVFKNLGDGIRDAINQITFYLSQIDWASIGTLLTNTFVSIDWGGIGVSILNMLWEGLSGILTLFLSIDWGQVGQKISDSVKEWIETIITKFQQTDWVQLGMDIANAIIDFITNVDWIGLGRDILLGLGEGILACIEFIIGLFAKILDRILEFFGVHSPSTVFKDLGINLIKGMIEGIKSIANKVLELFRGIWDGIKNIFSSVGQFFKDTFSNAWNAVKNIFSTGGKIFDGIKEGILNSFKNIVNAIITGINKVVAIPFDGINRALGNLRSVDLWGWKPFEWIPQIKVPQIPYLAKGDVIPPRHEFMAVLGDQRHGTNIEAPLETIKQADREVMSEFMDKMLNYNQQEKDIIFRNLTLIAQFGDRNFQKLVVDSLRLSEKELGKPLLVS